MLTVESWEEGIRVPQVSKGGALAGARSDTYAKRRRDQVGPTSSFTCTMALFSTEIDDALDPQ